MKNLPYYIIAGLLIIILAILAYFFWIKPEKVIEIHKTEYKDSPINDSLKKANEKLTTKVVQYKDTLKNFAYTRIIFKTDTAYFLKETLVHDTAYILATDIISYQDSIIINKEGIIVNLTNELKLTNDTAYYFQELYTTTNKKLKRWRWFGIGSGAMNVLLFMKK